MQLILSQSLMLTFIGIVVLPSSLTAGDAVRQAGYGANCHWETNLDIPALAAPQLLWTQTVGEGRSQVVTDEKNVYVVSGRAPDPKADPESLTTTVKAVTIDSGTEVWSFEVESRRYASQETFSGAKPCPRATPLLQDDRLFVVSFSGQLVCLSALNGEELWTVDLVEDYGALPVQFGFSASVVVEPNDPQKIFVVAAGPKSGFFCLNAGDGAKVWKADCTTFSYATPVMANFASQRQWVLVTENEVLGVAVDSGRSLWSYKLPKQGLTNVPTPLVINDRQLLISGQGCQGTISLQIAKADGIWNVKQQWLARRLQFFYTNWIKLNDRIVIGCTDKYLAAISIDSGEVLGRWRGFADGHILSCDGGQLLVLGGKGKLSILTTNMVDSDSSLLVNRQYQLVSRRCWTPLSASGYRLYLRHDDQLISYTFAASGSSGCLDELAGKKFALQLIGESQSASQPTNSTSLVEQIFATFENSGPETALQLYQSLRIDGKLNEAARIALIEAARQTGQHEIAAMILNQAMEDFPRSVEIKALKQK